MKILSSKWMFIALTAGSIYVGSLSAQPEVPTKEKPAQTETNVSTDSGSDAHSQCSDEEPKTDEEAQK